MTNDFKLNAGLKIPAVKGFTDAMKAAIPVLDDLDIKVLETVWASPLASEASFEIEVTLPQFRPVSSWLSSWLDSRSR